MYDLFISYSSADRGWAEILEQKLTPSVLVFRDKSRLSAAEPFQQQLFDALEDSRALLIIWSGRVRDPHGRWKEWVITEREHFRRAHPQAPIIYLLLDQHQPNVDAHLHNLDDVKGITSPDKVDEISWTKLTDKIKRLIYSKRVEVDCYVLACTSQEFMSLETDQNLNIVLNKLRLNFHDAAKWYGTSRDEWRPAGAQPMRTMIGQLEQVFTDVLTEDGVRQSLKNKPVFINSSLSRLWEELDDDVRIEIDRLAKLQFVSIFVDPLSLYHPKIQKAAIRVGGCMGRNDKVNVFILDPIERIYDRSQLRSKLQADFDSLYLPLVKPRWGRKKGLGGVDVWHLDDFERAFRQTVGLGEEPEFAQERHSPQSRLTIFGGRG